MFLHRQIRGNRWAPTPPPTKSCVEKNPQWSISSGRVLRRHHRSLATTTCHLSVCDLLVIFVVVVVRRRWNEKREREKIVAAFDEVATFDKPSSTCSRCSAVANVQRYEYYYYSYYRRPCARPRTQAKQNTQLLLLQVENRKKNRPFKTEIEKSKQNFLSCLSNRRTKRPTTSNVRIACYWLFTREQKVNTLRQ